MNSSVAVWDAYDRQKHVIGEKVAGCAPGNSTSKARSNTRSQQRWGLARERSASGCAGQQRVVVLKRSVAGRLRELPHDSPQSNERGCPSFWLEARRLMAFEERCGRVREWPR
jgi:hypothetical protein